ncbi:MAG: hypothetical protein B6I19_11090 [Bacteroidetes bacterium 4572_114]|nr:MAG: hypothetical protein B6I19_11090 [Bacteroidetes bacterium 4572_114]
MKTTEVKSRATTSRAVANTIKANARQAHVQTKLTVGQPGDKYEQEADQVADQVMSMTGPQVQRQCTGETFKRTEGQAKCSFQCTTSCKRMWWPTTCCLYPEFFRATLWP